MNFRDSSQVSFGPVLGHKDEVVGVTTKVFLLFRGEKLVARDTADGVGTLVRQIYVDGAPVFPTHFSWWERLVAWVRRRSLGLGIPTLYFDASAVGNGLTMPTCHPGKDIAIEIAFLVDCEWRGTLMGRTLR